MTQILGYCLKIAVTKIEILNFNQDYANCLEPDEIAPMDVYVLLDYKLENMTVVVL